MKNGVSLSRGPQDITQIKDQDHDPRDSQAKEDDGQPEEFREAPKDPYSRKYHKRDFDDDKQYHPHQRQPPFPGGRKGIGGGILDGPFRPSVDKPQEP